jgi:ketosteroid isomerase-like protein
MNFQITSLALTLAFSASNALAHGSEEHAPSRVQAGRETADAVQSIAPEANEAVAILERFSAALSAGDLEAAGAQLDPAVLILESGGAEHSREEYLGGHATHDADFLRAAHITLKRRTAQASGDLVWVGSESDIQASKDDKVLKISSTETAVLRKRAQGWKIVHVHWSSRVQR